MGEDGGGQNQPRGSAPAGTDPGLGREGHDRVALSQRRDDGEDSPRRGGPQWRRLDPRGNSFEIISLSSNLNSTGIRKSFTINAHSSSALISVCHRGNLKRPVHDGDGLFCKFGWLDSVEALFTECSSETHDPRRNDFGSPGFRFCHSETRQLFITSTTISIWKLARELQQ